MDGGDSTRRLFVPPGQERAESESQLSYRSLSRTATTDSTSAWSDPFPSSYELEAADFSLERQNHHAGLDDEPRKSPGRLGDEHQHDDSPRRLWAPFALRRTTLLAFAAGFSATLVVLIALYVVSRGTGHGSKGISAVERSYRLLWKYGPTAVFMILNALWNQSQYRASQLVPWVLMSQGNAPASRSVLLDYVSDWNVVALFRALKRKDFLVVLVVTGSLLIACLTVFSTGLFALGRGSASHSATFTTTHSFDDSGFHPTAVDSEGYAINLGVGLFNMDEPLGTVGKRVYQPFRDVATLQNNDDDDPYAPWHSYRTKVDILMIDLACQDASTSSNDDEIIMSQPDTDCTVRQRLSPDDMSSPDDTPPDNITDSLVLHMSIKDCSGEDAEFNKTSFDIGERDWKLWAIAARLPSDPKADNATEPNLAHYDLKSVVCEPRLHYTHDPVEIMRTGNGRLVSHHPLTPGVDNEIRSPLRVTAADMLLAAYHSVYSSRKHSRADDTPSKLLSFADEQLDPYWDSDLLARRIETSVSKIAAQVARKYLLRPPGGTRTAGSVTSDQDRLIVQDLSFGMMVGILTILIALALYLIFAYLPVAVCSRDPSSIGGLATILARSPEFEESLRDMSTTSAPDMEPLLSEQQYCTRTSENGGFSICQDGARTEPSVPSDEIRWWRPFSTRIPVRFLILGLPMALIATLESLYQHSNKSNGIARVDPSSSVAQSAWVYLPAFVMLCVRALYQTLEFAARVFQPYHCLRKGGTSPDSSVLENQHRKISLLGLISALRRRHWALAAASFPVLVGAFLPVLVSGLYTAEPFAKPEEASLDEHSIWNFTESTDPPYYATGAQIDAAGSIILHHDIPYPRWTHNDLVFPHVRMSDWVRSSANTSLNYIEGRLPALRGNLNCKQIPPSGYEVGFDSWGSTRNIAVNISRIDECDIPEVNLRMFTPTVGDYFGRSLDLLSIQKLHDQDEGHQWYPPGDDCPTRFYMYGKTPKTNTTASDSVTMLGCRPRIELVDADVRLMLPYYDFNASHPPSAVPGSARIVADAVLNQTNSSFADVFPGDYDLKLMLMYLQLGNAKDGTEMLGPEFQTAIYSRNGKSAEALLDPSTLAQELRGVFGVLVAQVLNNWGRQPLSDSDSDDKDKDKDKDNNNKDNDNDNVARAPRQKGSRTFHASLLVHELHLKQAATATRLVEAALAAMVVSGAVAMMFMDTRRVLPKNPCSIAALGSLLAGSRMLGRDIIPRGAEWCDDKRLKKRGVFEGRTFSLGWRGSRDGSIVVHEGQGDGVDRTASANRRFGIDVDVNAEP